MSVEEYSWENPAPDEFRCRCLGIDLDLWCYRPASQEDGLCWMCRVGDGRCCEDFIDYYEIDYQRAQATQRQLQEGDVYEAP